MSARGAQTFTTILLKQNHNYIYNVKYLIYLEMHTDIYHYVYNYAYSTYLLYYAYICMKNYVKIVSKYHLIIKNTAYIVMQSQYTIINLKMKNWYF